ncbi:MAG TPA: dipeptide epimerase [Chitinophagaceae bacterium]|nr:dipeptide epimerase [Chitinophagaceae bacterium]
MKVHYEKFNLKFRYPFTISKGTKTHQPTLIVSLEKDGLKGYGEAAAIRYYNIPVEQMIADLEKHKTAIETYDFTEPESFWQFLHALFPNNNFLVCALDIAAWDLYGKIKNKPLYQLWNGDVKNNPVCDYTIGIDSIEKMVEKMKAKPWPIYKIKLGTAEDLEIMKALRKNTEAVFRVDANAGWDLQTAKTLIPELESLKVEMVEQPLAKDDWQGMEELYRFSALPLYADEACVYEQDVAKCVNHFHGINIKLTKCGGITPARRMIQQARKLNLKVMIGCMNESTVGTAAIAQLLPFLDLVDMDGPLLLEEDVAKGIDYDFGKISVSTEPGLGIIYTGLLNKK